jgi:glycine cleavage system H protein
MCNVDYNVMPDNDMKCVWMTSGIISYKLCSLNFFCEDCAFDRVMHNETVSSNMDGSLTPDLSSAGLSSNRLDGSLFYHKNHCWIKVINPDEVVIGINGILAKLIYGIRTVVLPKIGDSVTRDQIFSHVLQKKQIVPLTMPINGVITAVNTALEKRPELLRTEFRGKGWLVTIKSDNLEKELRTLTFGSKAMEWYRAKDRSISEAIHAAYNSNRENIGPTMHDGGELVLNASEILTSEQYNKILDELSR